jgi:hypothetical protein
MFDDLLPADCRVVVIVEGASDRAAIETLAVCSGVDLLATGVAVVAVGGVTNFGHAIGRFGPDGLGLALGGLCDDGEVGFVWRAIRRAGLTPVAFDDVDPSEHAARLRQLERLGFFACHRDLEDELIRAIGPSGVEEVLADHGELDTFRTFQKQPAQTGRPLTDQLHRFVGTKSGRKERLAAALVDRLGSGSGTDRRPPPLVGVLSYALGRAHPGA